MSGGKARPTVDEIFAALEKSSLPTVIVEGVDDIVFYRRIEEDLSDIGIDMLPAGDKTSVLSLRNKIKQKGIKIPVAFVVDNDTWIYFGKPAGMNDVITTAGYSVENDLFLDGSLLSILDANELVKFHSEKNKFLHWFALAVNRYLTNPSVSYREHPNHILDDIAVYNREVKLNAGENYPQALFQKIDADFGSLLRGKSLYALLSRQLSRKNRPVKMGKNQLMEFASSRRGPNYQRMCSLIRNAFP